MKLTTTDLNTLLFNPIKPKIGHKLRVYTKSSSLVSIARKYQNNCIKTVFLISQFQKYCKSGKSPKAPAPNS